MNNKLSGINFTYLLLEYYKELNISNNELLVLLMSDHLINDGNKMITNELLELKLDLPFFEIDEAFNSLLTKKYIFYETNENEFVTSLKNIKEILLDKFKSDLLISDKKQDAASHEIKLRVISTFEHYFDRPLSKSEKNMIEKWLDNEIEEETIIDALKDAYNLNQLNLSKIDKLIAKKISKDDE